MRNDQTDDRQLVYIHVVETTDELRINLPGK